MSDAQGLAEVEKKAKAAKIAARSLATIGTATKKQRPQRDGGRFRRRKKRRFWMPTGATCRSRRIKGVPAHMRDRLALNDKRIAAMQEGLHQLIALPDPVGVVVGGWRRPNGLQMTKIRVPLGVLGIIYESRPNVTVDAASLCLKAGNAVVLRGGSEAIYSNIALKNVISQAAGKRGNPGGRDFPDRKHRPRRRAPFDDPESVRGLPHPSRRGPH